MCKRTGMVAALVLLAAGCGEQQQEPAQSGQAAGSVGNIPQPTAMADQPTTDEATVRMGHQLYLQHCAECHGEHAQGAPNWQKPGPDGKYPAPPLNGTGHAWHHPMPALRQTIAFGTKRVGGSMPAWKDELSGEQINAIISWFQSQWPAELYQAWQEMSARKGG